MRRLYWPLLLILLAGTCTGGLAQSPRMVFGSYFGGLDFEYGNAVALGPGGDIWFAGTTLSSNLPVVNASQSRCAGGAGGLCQDAFLVRLSADGKTVRFATYFGGSESDSITAMAVDDDGYAYVAGSWGAAAMAARFDPDGKPLWRVTLGNAPHTRANAVAFDFEGNLYMTGQTTSTSFPTVGALYPNPGPASCQIESGERVPFDAFVAKISAEGTVLFSTYLPGNGNDYGMAIAVDSLGRIAVGGGTSSTDLPMRRPIIDRYRGGVPSADGCGPGDAFLLQLAPDGSSVLFGTLLGTSGNDEIATIHAETNGLLTILGSGGTGLPPTLPPPQAANSFVARVDPDAALVLHSQLVRPRAGHANADATGRIAGGVGSLFTVRLADGQFREVGGIGAFVQDAIPARGGSVLAVGSASATLDFFRPTDAFQPRSGGLSDAFIAAVTPGNVEPETLGLNAASYAGPEIAPSSIATLFHPGDAASIQIEGQATTIVSQVTGQTSVLVPEGLRTGAITLAVLNADGGTIARGAARSAAVAPGVFTADANGRGAPAAQLIRIARDGARSEQSPFDCSSGTCIPSAIDTSDAQADSVLILYGTGIRNRSALSAVRAFVAGEPVAVDYAGAQPSYAGLDQVNVRLPEGLKGRGLVTLVLSVDGRFANPVRLLVR